MWPVKIVPEMSYKVSSGTLNLCLLTHHIPTCLEQKVKTSRTRPVNTVLIEQLIDDGTPDPVVGAWVHVRSLLLLSLFCLETLVFHA